MLDLQYKRLSEADRDAISRGVAAGLSYASIATSILLLTVWHFQPSIIGLAKRREALAAIYPCLDALRAVERQSIVRRKAQRRTHASSGGISGGRHAGDCVRACPKSTGPLPLTVKAVGPSAYVCAAEELMPRQRSKSK
jgi:hypothetical protein